MKSKKKKLFKILFITIGAFLVIYLGLSVYGARQAMVIPRLPVVYAPSALGVLYEEVAFKSRGDNVTLKGWFVPGTNKDVILVVHGGFQNRIDDNVDTGGLTHALAEKGHSVLLFDLRGRGESEGRGLSLSNIGWDIGGAVDYLERRGFSNNDICILGFCSGAASTCIYASGNSVGAIILDGCFIDVPTMVVRQGESAGIPKFLTYFFMPGTKLFAHLLYGYTMVNPIDVIHKVSCPILFVHEEYDEFITSAETMRLYRAAGNPADEVWEASDTEHSQAFRTHPVDFVNKIDAFIARVTGKTYG